MRTRLILVGAVLLAMGLAFNWSMSRSYGYDLVYDGQGNTYSHVDCGTHWNAGRSTATAIRASAGGDDARLHEADVIEQVCQKSSASPSTITVAGLVVLGMLLWFVFRRS